MSLRILAATRKGLFLIERSGASPNSWRVADTRFLGDNVSMVLCDPRDQRVHAALDHGHFGVKMHRAAEWSAPFEECPAPAYPEKPPASRNATSGARRSPGRPCAWALEPGGADEPHALWCGTPPAASSAPRIPARAGSSCARSGTTRCARNGSAAAPTCPGSIRSASTRANPPSCASASPAPAWTTRDRGASWSCEGQGHVGRLHAARAQVRHERAGSAPRRAVPGRARPPVGAAPQRHLSVPPTRG